ncbi:MAG TPA: TonB-dependent receptor [Terracidiphilus sp.]|nr:TonB-dependent receptor [Terracidiphilus sp.]
MKTLFARARHATWFVTLCLFALVPAVHGQTAVDGAIGGNVQDTTGALISNATVVVHNSATNAEQTATTDDSGYYRVIHLAPGLYNVTVSASGFEAFRVVNVTVQVGSLTDVDAKLTVGSSTQSVEVTGDAPLVNTTSPDFSGVVDQIALHNLPENNYRWSAFALLTPGVVNDSNGYGLLSFRGQSTLLNNVSIDGTDDNQAYFSEERGRTRAGYSTIKAAVQEFQVNTSNYSVEYGRSAGGIVNSVTKSGSNAFHGEGYYYDRDSAWAAQNGYVTHPVQVSANPITYSVQSFKPTDLRRQYGGAVGGPILKDRLFFFVAADRFYHDFPAASTILGTSANSNFYTLADATLPAGKTCGGSGSSAPSYPDAQVCQFSKATGLSYSASAPIYQNGINGLTALLGTVPRIGEQVILFPKFDWAINAKHHASVEGNQMRWSSPAGIQTSPAVAYGMASFGNDYVRDNWIVGKLDSFLTSSLSNEARYMYGRDFEFEFNQSPTSYEKTNLINTPSGYVNPYGLPVNVFLSGFFQFGTAQFLNRAALPDERRYQISDTVNWIKNNHSFKFGGDFLHTNDLISNLFNQYGGYSYTGNTPLGNYVADLYLSQNPINGKTAENYNSFNQGAGPAGLEFTTGDYSLFAQDEWKVSPRLSLTMGVRWDYEDFPKQQLPVASLPYSASLHTSVGNVGPRVGFAYDLFGSGRTVLRGGYGIFYARAINSTLYQALIGSGSPAGQTNPTLNPGSSCAPQFPQIVPAASFGSCLGGSSGNATAYYINPNFKLPQIEQGDMTVEQQIGKSSALSVSYLGSWGKRLPNFVDTNLPAPTPVSFTVTSSAGPLKQGQVVRANAYFYDTANPNHRPNPSFSSITDIYSGVTSDYEALVVQFNKRMAHNFSVASNYTWSHALDYGENNTTGASATAMLDPHNIKLDYGNSNQNVPNRFSIFGVVTSPWHFTGPLSYLLNDFQMAPDFAVQNGLPYSLGISGSSSKLYTTPGSPAQQSIIATGSFNGTGGANRVPGFDRNIFQMPHTMVVDLRLSKSVVIRERYNLEFLAESFNLANHQNVNGVGINAYVISEDTTNHVNNLAAFTSTPFQSVTSTNNSNFAYNVRQIQMALRLKF